MAFGHLLASVFCFLLINRISNCLNLAGRGLADVTGLISEGLLYGYANPNQDARGIHTRQFSRAFAFSDGKKFVALAIVDTCTISQAVHKGVMENLQMELGSNFTECNVMLLPTHSHSLPGGYNTYWLYQAASNGFVNETYEALVRGIAQSIISAFEDLQESRVFMSSDNLLGASINRSPYAYYNNPSSETSQYEHDTDKTMHLVKLTSGDKLLGLISLFPVHPTSLKYYNHLVSSDNKGYASLKMEAILNPRSLAGKGKILAAFGQTANGDSTPNINGSRCKGSGRLCSYTTSTCPEAPLNPKFCEGKGSHGEQFKDAEIIGDKQSQKAEELLGQTGTELVGSIDYRFLWVKMSQKRIKLENKLYKTCLPAMGYSFGAGATDGPGISPFTQGRLETIDYIENITDLLFNKSREEIDCHFPKPILLPTGQIAKPYAWQPEIVPLQIFKMGSLILVGVPAEVTTMAGRRIQKAVKETLVNNGFSKNVTVVIASMANSYSSYLTTFEEYQVQRYEGASNTFGPHSLEAYVEEFKKIAHALGTGKPLDKGTSPPDLRGKQRNALGKLKVDILPKNKHFGQILADTKDSYHRGEIVEVTFLSGNPRNDLTTDPDPSLLEILRQDKSGSKSIFNESWTVEFNDASWETKMFWNSACHGRRPGLLGDCTFKAQLSNVTVAWSIPMGQNTGHYMIAHYGTANKGEGLVEKYSGFSRKFKVE